KKVEALEAQTTTVAPPTTAVAPTTTTAAPTTTTAPTTNAASATTAVTPELAVACKLDTEYLKVMCWASGYQTDRQLKWTSNASTRWQYGPATEILLGEIPIPAETQVLLEECLGTTCQTVVTLIDTLALAPEEATVEASVEATVGATTAVSPEGVEVLCFFEPSKPGFHCAANGYAHGSQLLWESNVSGEAESDFYEVTFTARHQLVAEILVTLKECLGVDCQTIETSIDSSVLSN
ncbi:uncharacterized protein METZ01_LOCUS495401, partial [marine metagenome]